MSREEYMRELKFKLSKADKELFDEITSDYEAHFNDGLAAGKTEDEICMNLGSIDELVQELGIEAPASETSYDLPDSVQYDQTSDGKTVDTVYVDGFCADVTVRRSTNGKLTFNYENHGSFKQTMLFRFNHRHEGNVVYATIEKTSTKSRFFMSITNPSITLEVNVPDGMKVVDIKTLSGDLDVTGFTSDSMTYSTVSGDLNVRNLKSQAIRITTTSGDLNISSLDTPNLEAHTVSGDIKFDSMNTSNISLSTTSGDISSSSLCACNAWLKSISGDVRFSILKTDGYSADVASTSGDINLYYNSEIYRDLRNGNYAFGNSESKITARTVSGDISIRA